MTVTVTQPSINVREKLAELDKPTGIAGEAMLRAETPQEQQALIGVGRRNIIINGAMNFDQRNSGSAVTPTADQTYTLDRFSARLSAASKYSVQRVADGPAGYSNSLKVTSAAATTVGTNDYYQINTPIEGYNTNQLAQGSSDAKQFTLSFWVKSSLTGTFGGAYSNNAGNRFYAWTYTIDAANTWEHKSITITGSPDGSWESTTNSGLWVYWTLGAGSGQQGSPNSWSTTFKRGPTGATNVVATSGATWQITGVQLEVGKVATPFEHRSYGEELALCSRYFQRLKFNGGYTKVCLQYGTTSGLFTIEYSTKRSIPTIVTLPTPTTSTNQVNGISLLTSSGSYRSATGSETVTASHISEDTCRINLAGFAASGSTGDATWGYFTTTSNPSGCHIDVQAEL